MHITDESRIAVVGTGLAGKGVTHLFSFNTFNVDVFSVRNDAPGVFLKYFNGEIEKGRITPEQKISMLKSMRFFNINSQGEKLADSDLIVETSKGDFNTKKDMLGIISNHARDSAIIACNTIYSITKLAECVSNPGNFIGMNFIPPVPLIKLVEIIMGEKTDEKVTQAVCQLVNNVGKVPIRIKDSVESILDRDFDLLAGEIV